VEKNMRAFIAGQTEESLLRDVTFTNPKGETFTLPLWQMVVQPPNHNTHHRGELAAMFALMNVPHPEEEIVQYFLVKSGQRKGLNETRACLSIHRPGRDDAAALAVHPARSEVPF
jgi:uncharacterized damage-inducible protein DinB